VLLLLDSLQKLLAITWITRMPTYNLKEGTVQYGFQKSRAKIQIMGGGFGNGKTTAGVVKALQLAREYPGSNGLIARSTFPKLNDTIRKEFYKWCPTAWIERKVTSQDNVCEFEERNCYQLPLYSAAW
jgi:hypothetical protein